MSVIENLKTRVRQYHTILDNTASYRSKWGESLKQTIMDHLSQLVKETELRGKVDCNDQVNNLGSITLNLGREKSGIGEKIEDGSIRPFIKHNGVLLYQQLFNGKIQVMIVYPFIEGYGQPGPPKTIAIYRPEEITEAFITRHVEEFIREIINWEDFDDDEPSRTPIGFNPQILKSNDEITGA